ncbi:MAG: hypothetical protein A2790_00680 [Phenylobacterium sp. RIFCSPHIGHO2_01_FULL_69_31]|jgi:hypothetical protein|uniref:hypothetical protein n=1 Tax=Phenylobacterium sp. RIFCSPHIGHO2_01_FULL_69_31 TaxID=1801944 RepID=UPI0008C4921B|nr:hypothetical protein [Phenylobacterium sp. RIFCSPHIGHO2_01_FULL_69_31]OHB27214.1 MAG: hypothetical protein A2790_00680 [Phenylobacterium sp. RIFCSPHIGHO2_01_FULL_69_31]
MFRALVLAGALAITSPALGQPAGTGGASAVADQFFARIRSGDVTGAYQSLGRGTLLDQKQMELANVANQTDSMLKLYGKMIDWEMMSENKLSDSYVIRNYLVRTERGPVFFNFHLYHSPNGWVISNIYFTDILKNLMQMQP